MTDKDLKLIHDILDEIDKSNSPLGANILSLRIDLSQSTIGRILQNLEYQGYLEKSSNKGRIITEKGKKYLKSLKEKININNNAKELIRISSSADKNTLLDILYTRKILEKETAYLAAKNITEKEIQELTEIIDRQDEQKRLGLLGEKEDLQFHSKIADIAGNKILKQILILILTQKNAYWDFSYIRQKQSFHSPNYHRKIIEALSKKDPESTSKLMVEHIDSIISDVINYYEEELTEK